MESKLKIRWWSVVQKYSTLPFNAPPYTRGKSFHVFYYGYDYSYYYFIDCNIVYSI